MENRCWQHLHTALLVFAVNAGELGSHPCPVITRFQWHPSPTDTMLSLPLFVDVPAAVSSCHRMCILLSLCCVIHLLMDGGLGGSALFAEVTACLGFVFGRTANPQELPLLSKPGAEVLTSTLRPAVLPLPSSRCPCPWA